MKTIPLIYFFLFSVSVSTAQVLEGRIIDGQNKAPLPFVNIGVMGRGIGTVSDATGQFQLDVSDAQDTDSLKLSYIGFDHQVYVLSSLRANPGYLEVILQPSNYALAEVEIRPKDLYPLVLGNAFSSPMVAAGFKSSELGSEAGTVMKVKDGVKHYLETIGFFVANNKYDSILFRLNIYSYHRSEVGQVLHRVPIYVSVLPGQSHIRVDLRDYYLTVDDDFVVTLEVIQDVPDIETGFLFCAGFFGEGTIARQTSQDTFKHFAFIGLGIYCESLYEKPDK